MFSNIIPEFFSEILVALIIFTLAFGRKLVLKLKNKTKLNSKTIIWAPGGDRMYYVMNYNGKRKACIYDAVKKKKIKLQIPIVDKQLPVWSPDGEKIAFVSDKDGNKEIYIVNADGSNLQRITNDPAEDIYPEWSFDGKQINFISRKNGDTKTIIINLADFAD